MAHGSKNHLSSCPTLDRNGGFPKLGGGGGGGTLLGVPHNKDYSILGSILGSPYFEKLPNHAELN